MVIFIYFDLYVALPRKTRLRTVHNMYSHDLKKCITISFWLKLFLSESDQNPQYPSKKHTLKEFQDFWPSKAS